MKAKDATYYAEQINLDTAFQAEARGGELIVREGGNGREAIQAGRPATRNAIVARTRDEDEADRLYHRLVNESLAEGGMR